MRLVRDYTQCPPDAVGAVVALGNFDGVHLGHQSVISRARSIADEHRVPCAIMTFMPHPLRIIKPDLPLTFITSFAEKLRLLERLGVEIVYAPRFTPSFSALSAQDFIQHVLVDCLKATHVVTGHNFIFGHQRQGNIKTLSDASQTYGYGFTQCDEAISSSVDLPISSTSIRKCLQDGNLSDAQTLLGRPFALSGMVIQGDQRGRTLGFPTANIALRSDLPIAHGVYACRITTSASPETVYGVANIGIRPTFITDKTRLLEVFIFDFSGDLYGKKLHVELVDYIRPERSFSSVDALKEAIECDILSAQSILGT